MKTRLTALVLALAMLSALAVYAAQDGETPGGTPETVEEAAAEAAANAAAEAAADAVSEAAEAAANAAAEAAMEAAAEAVAEAAEAAAEAAGEADAADSPEGPVTFGDLERRIRENNLTLRALELRIENIDSTNMEDLRRNLVDGLNAMADAQWRMLSNPITALGASQLQSSYDALRDQLDDLKEGRTARNLESARRQMAAGEAQLIAGMESAYIQLKGLEEQEAALSRGIAALDRGAQAARVSYEHGFVSQLSLDAIAAQRTQLESSLQSLRNAQDIIALNVKAAVGAEPDAPLSFAALPKVKRAELDAMDLEADLIRAQEASAELLEAEITLDTAYRAWLDSDSKPENLRTWQAAQLTREASQQSFDLRFRTLYLQVKDAAQQAEAAKSAVAQAEKDYAAAVLRHKQLSISDNALADAKDTLADAKDKASSAERDLLSRYRSYYWAVEHGILN